MPLGRSKRRWKHVTTDIWELRLEGYGLDSSGYGQGTVASSCEQGNEPSAPLIGGGGVSTNWASLYLPRTLIYVLNYGICWPGKQAPTKENS
jgi:hypothetical protein